MKARETPAHLRAGANLALAEAMRGKGTGAGTHGDRRTKRLRTRGARDRAAVREQLR